MTYSATYYSKNRDRIRAQQKTTRIKRRMRVLRHYGGEVPASACCGETHYEFLSIDHIEGGGTQHRDSLRGPNIDRWLIREGFPEGYRVLCHNCNQALGLYGECPHLRE